MYIGNEPEPFNDPDYEKNNKTTDTDIRNIGIVLIILITVCVFKFLLT